MSGGWVKIHRKIWENPFFTRSRVYSNLEAFLWMIMRANHKDGQFFIGTQIVNVKRGQLITSQKKMCNKFKWSNSKLRNYLKVAQKASMIKVETTSKTTCITIIKYDTYQDSHTEEKLQKNQRNTEEALKKHTNKNDKKEKNNKNMINFDLWWDSYNYKVGRDRAYKLWCKISEKQKKLIMLHTPDYVKSTTKEDTADGQFKPKRKHPSTYLYNRAWNDEIIKTDMSDKYKADDFRTDGGGINKIGYCIKCEKHDFYTPYEILSAESKCCNSKLKPQKTKIKQIGG